MCYEIRADLDTYATVKWVTHTHTHLYSRSACADVMGLSRKLEAGDDGRRLFRKWVRELESHLLRAAAATCWCFWKCFLQIEKVSIVNVLGKVEMRRKDEAGSGEVAEEAQTSTQGSEPLHLRDSVIQLPRRAYTSFSRLPVTQDRCLWPGICTKTHTGKQTHIPNRRLQRRLFPVPENSTSFLLCFEWINYLSWNTQTREIRFQDCFAWCQTSLLVAFLRG